MSTFKDLIGIRFLSQNVNSMNISSRFQIKNKLNRFDQKLESFLSKKAGIIFLQDMRLGLEGEGIFRKRLEFHKYGNFHLYSNSAKSSRGVSIVINSVKSSAVSVGTDPSLVYRIVSPDRKLEKRISNDPE